MNLDLRTIYLMDAALYLMLHAAIWVGLVRYQSRVVASWSLSGIVSALGLVFLGMQGVWSDGVIMLIGQPMMVVGNFGRQWVLRSMLGPVRKGWLWGQGLFNLAYMVWGMVLFLQGGDYLPGLTLLFYGFYTLNLIEYVLIGREMRKKTGLDGAWAIEFAGVAFCVSLGIKTVALLGGWGEFSLYTMAWDQAVVFMGQFVAISLINVGFLQAFVGQTQQAHLRAENDARLHQQRSELLEQHAQDVDTLLKEREEIIRQLTLSNKSAGMGALVAGIAHEVNQPLTGMVINTEIIETLLHQPHGREDARKLSGDIRTDAIKVSNIVRTLRSMFMARSGHFEQHDVVSVLRDVLLIVEGRRQRLGIALTSSLTDQALVWGDVTQLQQVILNLLNNAMDAVSDVAEPSITVHGEKQDGQFVLSVSDNGPGIAPERQKDLFALFKTTKAEGMGVGLWLSRSIVEAHGGRLVFETPTAAGAVFCLRLPLV